MDRAMGTKVPVAARERTRLRVSPRLLPCLLVLLPLRSPWVPGRRSSEGAQALATGPCPSATPTNCLQPLSASPSGSTKAHQTYSSASLLWSQATDAHIEPRYYPALRDW
ncbi:hypothetical protein H920_08472 [Fukomys damarensis]|uniref:Uncharacterized protein n=1 Tax=Fukomys damarensis TaxID=885580 RepID=A0A091DIM9_FUKDA|nr:hypothetical protein H920_08472 [Fukomys damarensis]